MADRICKIDGCGRKHKTLGLCDMHAKRQAAHGDPLTVKVYRRPHGTPRVMCPRCAKRGVSANGLCSCCNRADNRRAARAAGLERLASSEPKRCLSCGIVRPAARFTRTRWCKDGRMGKCIDCRRDSRFGVWLKRRYGLTLAAYTAMLESQGGVCKICGGGPKCKGRLYVDHCHRTGTVRGLLCSYCNSAIGLFKDNGSVMVQASAYVAPPPALPDSSSLLWGA